MIFGDLAYLAIGFTTTFLEANNIEEAVEFYNFLKDGESSFRILKYIEISFLRIHNLRCIAKEIAIINPEYIGKATE